MRSSLVRKLTNTCVSLAMCAVAAVNGFSISFDNTFATGGKYLASFPPTGDPASSGSQLFLLPSGKIIVVGSYIQQGTSSRTSGLLMVGLTSSGVPDSGFGTGGSLLIWSPAVNRYLRNSLLLPDNSFVVLHQFWESSASNRPVLSKFNSSGQQDVNFAPDLDLFPGSTYPVRVAPSAGGKFYVLVRRPTGDHYLIRLNADGGRDVTFGQNGVRPLPLNRFSPNPEVVDLHELPNGKLIVGGRYYQGGWDGGTFVARYDSDTNLDRSFGMQGATRIVYPNGTVNAVVMRLLPDGKILLGGNWTFLGSKSVLARLTPRGRLDSSFGSWGLAMEAFNDLNTISGIGVAADGKLIVAGACGNKAVPSNQRVLMMKYSGAGVREQSLVTDFTTNREAGASDLVVQPDSKVLITGFSQNPTDTRVRLAVGRLIP